MNLIGEKKKQEADADRQMRRHAERRGGRSLPDWPICQSSAHVNEGGAKQMEKQTPSLLPWLPCWRAGSGGCRRGDSTDSAAVALVPRCNRPHAPLPPLCTANSVLNTHP